MKHLILLLLFSVFLFSCNEKEKRSRAQICYEEALLYQEKGDLESALNKYYLARDASKKSDSIPYWTQSVANEGGLLLDRNDLKSAKISFETLLHFAQRRKLVELECLSWQRLGQVAWKEKKYVTADSCYKKAVDLSLHLKDGEKLLPDLKEEAWIAASASVWEKGMKGAVTLPDSLKQKLYMLVENSRADLKVEALRLLSLYSEGRSITDKDKRYLEQYVHMNDSLTKQAFSTYTERLEQEKAQLILERDREMDARQRILFISLAVLTLILIAGLYIMLSYRRKHEMDHIRMLLLQKEKDIIRLEQNQCELDKIQNLLREKEKRVTELEMRSYELERMRAALHNREQQLNELEQKFEELNEMRDKVILKQEELEEMERSFREARFYESELGRRIPIPDNPHKPTVKEFDSLLVKESLCDEFLSQMNACYNNFAKGLQQLSPKLTRDDVVYCCLFHLGVRPSDIALMLCVSRNAVSMRRRRIEEKIG